MALVQCPECHRDVSSAATSCPGCGHPIRMADPATQPIFSDQPVQTPQWSPGVAAVLSLVIPGAGQMYKGGIGAGILWLVFVSIGYFCFIIPGLILHLICIFNAASGHSSK